jgi:integrase
VGSLYQRGNIWWVKYYRNSRPIRESSHSAKKMVARKLLERREGEISLGLTPGSIFSKVNFNELAEGLLRDYRINQKKSLKRADLSVRTLKRHFSGMKATQITTPVIEKYILQRVDDGMANSSINRELAALKRMFNLGYKQTPPIINRVPHIPRLKENNVRKGFFEHWEFVALKGALPDYLKGFIVFAYRSGWRISEIASLTWSQVDRHKGIVRLEASDSKNAEARTLYLDEELKNVLNHQWSLRKKSRKILPYVFLNEYGTDRIKRFDKAWKKACREAEISVKIFHDFRRTAVRNMVRSGIPERVAMLVSGHKTRSVFDRYNIVNDEDLKLASERHSAYLQAQNGHNLGTVQKIGEDKQKSGSHNCSKKLKKNECACSSAG